MNDITILKEAVLRIELGHAVNTGGGGAGDVTKAYVDFQDNLKVDKLAGHSLISDVEKARLANVTNYDDSAIIEEFQNKVDKVDGKSLIADTEIAKLADYPTLNPIDGAANKFLNEKGELVTPPPSSIGVQGQNFYALPIDSDVAGYKLLSNDAGATESETTITARSFDGIVWGDKYVSAPFAADKTLNSSVWGFNYWRKVSSAQGDSTKHLRIFILRGGVEINIGSELQSPPIDDLTFAERAITYTHGQVNFLTGDRIGMQEGFSTTLGSNITFTYILGDGRGWFARFPFALEHKDLEGKNEEAEFQHVDERINEIPASAGGATYTLLNRRQNLITGTLPNGVNSALVLPTIISGERNEVILHFKTNAVASPTLVYSGFTPVWLNGRAISMKINKQYTIVFEQINGIVKTSFGEY